MTRPEDIPADVRALARETQDAAIKACSEAGFAVADYPFASGNAKEVLDLAIARALLSYGNRRAEEATERAGPKVKPLEWLEYERGSGFYAHAILGRYSAWEQSGVGYWNAQSINTHTALDGLEAAKAAAQKDYETRIYSALEIFENAK